MLKALRISTSIFRNFSQATPRVNYNDTDNNLVAQPAKLQKKIHFSSNPRWLHQDVKVGSKTIAPEVDRTQVLELARQSFANTRHNLPSPHLSRFCNECITRLGIENFKRFVDFNEHKVSNMKTMKCFEKHLPICLRIFNQDAFLLRLLAMCNLKAINKDAVSKILAREALETDDKKNDDDLRIYKLLPKEEPIFDSYINLEEKSLHIQDNQENQNNEKEINSEIQPEEIQAFSEKKYIIDSIITYHQLPTNQSKKSNWVYFQLESGQDDMLTEESVKSCFNKVKISSCQNMLLFKPQTPIQRFKIPSIRITTEDLKQSLCQEIDYSRLATLARSNKLSPAKQSLHDDESLTGDFSSLTSELEQSVKKFEEMIKFCSKVNARSRAYGFAEFENYEEKEKLLNNAYRLFGIEFDRAFLVIDDADNKKTIQLNNMPWNSNPAHFGDWLNNLGSYTPTPMKFTFEDGLENFLSDANYYYLEMNSFTEALTMIQFINSTDFSEKKIQAAFKRGCGRFVNGKLIENYISSNIERQQRVHIERRTRNKEAYLKRIANCLYQNYDDSVNR